MIGPILFIFICTVVQHNALEEVKSVSESDSSVLMKILQSVDAATSNDRLYDITLKLLKSLCVCMRDTLKDNEDNIILRGIISSKTTTSDLKVDLYKRIYNSTCIILHQELVNNINKDHNITANIEDGTLLQNTKCGKKIANELDIEINNSQLIMINREKFKLRNILYKALIQTKDIHKYKITTRSLFGKAKPHIVSKLKHSVIVIVTLHPLNKTIHDSVPIEEKELNDTIYLNSLVDIDILDTKYDIKGKESEERINNGFALDCNLHSIYAFLIESENKNLTKVVKLIRKNGTIKIYIDVTTLRNHTDYTSICCNNSQVSVCKKDFIKQQFEINEESTTEILKYNQSYQYENRNYKDTIRKLNELVKSYQANEDEKIQSDTIYETGIEKSTIRNQIQDSHIINIVKATFTNIPTSNKQTRFKNFRAIENYRSKLTKKIATPFLSNKTENENDYMDTELAIYSHMSTEFLNTQIKKTQFDDTTFRNDARIGKTALHEKDFVPLTDISNKKLRPFNKSIIIQAKIRPIINVEGYTSKAVKTVDIATKNIMNMTSKPIYNLNLFTSPNYSKNINDEMNKLKYKHINNDIDDRVATKNDIFLEVNKIAETHSLQNIQTSPPKFTKSNNLSINYEKRSKSTEKHEYIIDKLYDRTAKKDSTHLKSSQKYTIKSMRDSPFLTYEFTTTLIPFEMNIEKTDNADITHGNLADTNLITKLVTTDKQDHINVTEEHYNNSTQTSYIFSNYDAKQNIFNNTRDVTAILNNLNFNNERNKEKITLNYKRSITATKSHTLETKNSNLDDPTVNTTIDTIIQLMKNISKSISKETLHNSNTSPNYYRNSSFQTTSLGEYKNELSREDYKTLVTDKTSTTTIKAIASANYLDTKTIVLPQSNAITKLIVNLTSVNENKLTLIPNEVNAKIARGKIYEDKDVETQITSFAPYIVIDYQDFTTFKPVTMNSASEVDLNLLYSNKTTTSKQNIANAYTVKKNNKSLPNNVNKTINVNEHFIKQHKITSRPDTLIETDLKNSKKNIIYSNTYNDNILKTKKNVATAIYSTQDKNGATSRLINVTKETTYPKLIHLTTPIIQPTTNKDTQIKKPKLLRDQTEVFNVKTSIYDKYLTVGLDRENFEEIGSQKFDINSTSTLAAVTKYSNTIISSEYSTEIPLTLKDLSVNHKDIIKTNFKKEYKNYTTEYREKTINYIYKSPIETTPFGVNTKQINSARNLTNTSNILKLLKSQGTATASEGRHRERTTEYGPNITSLGHKQNSNNQLLHKLGTTYKFTTYSSDFGNAIASKNVTEGEQSGHFTKKYANIASHGKNYEDNKTNTRMTSFTPDNAIVNQELHKFTTNNFISTNLASNYTDINKKNNIYLAKKVNENMNRNEYKIIYKITSRPDNIRSKTIISCNNNKSTIYSNTTIIHKDISKSINSASTLSFKTRNDEVTAIIFTQDENGISNGLIKVTTETTYPKLIYATTPITQPANENNRVSQIEKPKLLSDIIRVLNFKTTRYGNYSTNGENSKFDTQKYYYENFTSTPEIITNYNNIIIQSEKITKTLSLTTKIINNIYLAPNELKTSEISTRGMNSVRILTNTPKITEIEAYVKNNNKELSGIATPTQGILSSEFSHSNTSFGVKEKPNTQPHRKLVTTHTFINSNSTHFLKTSVDNITMRGQTGDYNLTRLAAFQKSTESLYSMLVNKSTSRQMDTEHKSNQKVNKKPTTSKLTTPKYSTEKIEKTNTENKSSGYISKSLNMPIGSIPKVPFSNDYKTNLFTWPDKIFQYRRNTSPIAPEINKTHRNLPSTEKFNLKALFTISKPFTSDAWFYNIIVENSTKHGGDDFGNMLTIVTTENSNNKHFDKLTSDTKHTETVAKNNQLSSTMVPINTITYIQDMFKPKIKVASTTNPVNIATQLTTPDKLLSVMKKNREPYLTGSTMQNTQRSTLSMNELNRTVLKNEEINNQKYISKDNSTSLNIKLLEKINITPKDNSKRLTDIIEKNTVSQKSIDAKKNIQDNEDKIISNVTTRNDITDFNILEKKYDSTKSITDNVTNTKPINNYQNSNIQSVLYVRPVTLSSEKNNTIPTDILIKYYTPVKENSTKRQVNVKNNVQNISDKHIDALQRNARTNYSLSHYSETNNTIPTDILIKNCTTGKDNSTIRQVKKYVPNINNKPISVLQQNARRNNSLFENMSLSFAYSTHSTTITKNASTELPSSLFEVTNMNKEQDYNKTRTTTNTINKKGSTNHFTNKANENNNTTSTVHTLASLVIPVSNKSQTSYNFDKNMHTKNIELQTMSNITTKPNYTNELSKILEKYHDMQLKVTRSTTATYRDWLRKRFYATHLKPTQMTNIQRTIIYNTYKPTTQEEPDLSTEFETLTDLDSKKVYTNTETSMNTHMVTKNYKAPTHFNNHLPVVTTLKDNTSSYNESSTTNIEKQLTVSNAVNSIQGNNFKLLQLEPVLKTLEATTKSYYESSYTNIEKQSTVGNTVNSTQTNNSELLKLYPVLKASQVTTNSFNECSTTNIEKQLTVGDTMNNILVNNLLPEPILKTLKATTSSYNDSSTIKIEKQLPVRNTVNSILANDFKILRAEPILKTLKATTSSYNDSSAIKIEKQLTGSNTANDFKILRAEPVLKMLKATASSFNDSSTIITEKQLPVRNTLNSILANDFKILRAEPILKTLKATTSSYKDSSAIKIVKQLTISNAVTSTLANNLKFLQHKPVLMLKAATSSYNEPTPRKVQRKLTVSNTVNSIPWYGLKLLQLKPVFKTLKATTNYYNKFTSKIEKQIEKQLTVSNTVNNILVNNYKKQSFNKKRLLDPFAKTKLYPMKIVSTKSQRKLLRRIELLNQKKEIMTMNTQDFFSRRFVTQRNIRLPRVHTRPVMYRSVTSMPRRIILRPKFLPVDKNIQIERYRPKPLFIKSDKDAFREKIDFHKRLRPSGSTWRDKVGFSQTQVENTPIANDMVIERPSFDLQEKPYYKIRTASSTRRPIYHRQYFLTESDSDEDIGLPTFHYRQSHFKYVASTTIRTAKTRRKRRTIFFLSPTVPYNRYF